MDVSNALKEHLKDFGALEKDSSISEDEFIDVMSKWLRKARHSLLDLGRVARRVTAMIKFKHSHRVWYMISVCVCNCFCILTPTM